ncbi:MAG: hypothetical protein M3290_05390 [Actinomycetota bacterium]|nr:hypothetical protein [Actinomycetota bacterium]
MSPLEWVFVFFLVPVSVGGLYLVVKGLTFVGRRITAGETELDTRIFKVPIKLKTQGAIFLIVIGAVMVAGPGLVISKQVTQQRETEDKPSSARLSQLQLKPGASARTAQVGGVAPRTVGVVVHFDYKLNNVEPNGLDIAWTVQRAGSRRIVPVDPPTGKLLGSLESEHRNFSGSASVWVRMPRANAEYFITLLLKNNEETLDTAETVPFVCGQRGRCGVKI